jgi:uncharacterized membrane protein YphA (DoxX/SURF4 family)
MVIKSLLIFLVIAVLLEDGSSIKKTAEEEKEEREMAERVNATLAEEEEKERLEEEEKKRKKQDQDQVKKQEETGQETETGGTEKKKGQDEACPTLNLTCPNNSSCRDCPEVRSCLPCPEIKTCSPCEQCPLVRECPESKNCSPCKECGTCPDVESCQPCQPCSSNITSVQPPSTPGCPDSAQAMTVPVAMAVGAGAALLVTGVATVIGLVIRYVPPIVSGFILISTVIIVWYLSSQYPETARDLGRRAWTTLQEATVALGHRLVEAIRHHNDQVSFSFLSLSLLLPKNEFHVSKVCTKIFYVEKINF